jgi:hypothetical protein
MADKDLNRILDANFNRAKEGLRVCEDICRYVWNEKALTRSFKDVRHALTEAVDTRALLKDRNVGGDIGRPTSVSEGKRKDLNAVFFANCQRVKESLRVLEEIIKLKDNKTAEAVKNLRYKVYVLEQKAAGKS